MLRFNSVFIIASFHTAHQGPRGLSLRMYVHLWITMNAIEFGITLAYVEEDRSVS